MTNGFKIGSAVAILIIVGSVAFLINKVYSLKADLVRSEWFLFAKQAEVDTLKVIAEYSMPETVLVSHIRIVTDTLEGQITVDTVYESIPKIYGSIKIDTTRDFGPGSNPMKVRVVGEFWYPGEYSHRSWMLIHPVMGKKTPYLPPDRLQSKRWGLGLSYLRSFSGDNQGHQSDYFGASLRYKRLLMTSGYDPWQKSLIVGLNYEILSF